MALLEAQSLKKVYTTRFGGNQIQALSKVSFTVEQGEYVAIMGESGSGKTTLLNILAALDRPTGGQVILGGKSLSGVREKELAAFRRNNLGFVFQDFNLLDTFTLRDNIFLPLVLGGKEYREMAERLEPIARRLGIGGILDKFPYEVSGGQKQRAAVAAARFAPRRRAAAGTPAGAGTETCFLSSQETASFCMLVTNILYFGPGCKGNGDVPLYMGAPKKQRPEACKSAGWRLLFMMAAKRAYFSTFRRY